jgi:hypothetical protein
MNQDKHREAPVLGRLFLPPRRSFRNVSRMSFIPAARTWVLIACSTALLNVASVRQVATADAAAPITLAVFEFELDDVSAAGVNSMTPGADDLKRMQAVTAEARRVLAESGRYTLVDTSGADAEQVKQRTLHKCDGCDAGIALKLGAQRSMIGVITRVAKTEYYASMLITNTATDKPVNQQTAFFTGADDAWASGVRLLIKHGILADDSY